MHESHHRLHPPPVLRAPRTETTAAGKLAESLAESPHARSGSAGARALERAAAGFADLTSTRRTSTTAPNASVPPKSLKLDSAWLTAVAERAQSGPDDEPDYSLIGRPPSRST
jgi:hypothetical protein